MSTFEYIICVQIASPYNIKYCVNGSETTWLVKGLGIEFLASEPSSVLHDDKPQSCHFPLL